MGSQLRRATLLGQFGGRERTLDLELREPGDAHLNSGVRFLASLLAPIAGRSASPAVGWIHEIRRLERAMLPLTAHFSTNVGKWFGQHPAEMESVSRNRTVDGKICCPFNERDFLISIVF